MLMPKMLKPKEIRVQEPAICTATLGHVELETVAACIVLYHWEKDLDEWTPVSRRMIADWLPTSKYLQDVGRNPFWKLDIHGFITGGWITGWDRPGEAGIDDLGTVTEKFIEAVSNPKIGSHGAR
jgi:hypothetical protein